jgi:hypothetical protein
MVLEEIEGFSFATALDLNMGYYTIRSAPSYFLGENVPTSKGIAGSPDILQGKMLELMESLEYEKAYLDDLLCISKLSLEDHLEKLFVTQDSKSMQQN